MKADLEGVNAVQSWLLANDEKAIEVRNAFAALLE